MSESKREGLCNLFEELNKRQNLFADNKNNGNVSRTFGDIQKDYHELLVRIVRKSFYYLDDLDEKKRKPRLILMWFVMVLVSIQFIILFIFLGCRILNDTEIIASVISLATETVGLIAIIVRYLFNDKTALGIINAIQKVAENYKGLSADKTDKED